MEENSIFETGMLKINFLSRKVFVNGRQLFLRNKEFCLLEYFIKNIGKVINRTELLEDVWDRNIFCSTNTVDVHVSSLRKKINRYLRRKSSFIKTVHCIGYVFEPLWKRELKIIE